MVSRDECRSRWIRTDFQRGVVFLFQVSADFAEFRQCCPASADVTGARHSVTFALMSHQFMKSFSTDTVVVEIHQSSRVSHLSLAGINKLPGEIAAVSHISGASTPSEFTLLVVVLAQSCLVASAIQKIPTVASPRNGMYNSGGADGVDKSRFSTSSCFKSMI
jgi:hypothetical protein